MRDEGPYCVEWLAHHLAAGVDHFLIFTHDCTDGTDRILDALQAEGRVTHVRFKPTGGKSVQWQALKFASDHPMVKAAEWVLFFDCDEFLVLDEMYKTIGDMIDGFEKSAGQVDAIALPWRLFGSAGQTAHGDGITPERFVHCAPDDLNFPMSKLVKSLVRPKAFQKLGVHRPRRKKARVPRWLGPDGVPLPPQFCENDQIMGLFGLTFGRTVVGLNHYSVRSVDEFLIKRHRGLPNHMTKVIGLDYWVERNWNMQTCARISPMLAATRREIGAIMGEGDIAQLHDKSRSEHRARLGQLNTELESIKLRWQIGLVGENVVPTRDAVRAYIAQQINAKKIK